MGRVKEAFELDNPFEGFDKVENEQLQVAKELFNDKEGLKLKTELDETEIRGLARLTFIAQYYKIPALNIWIQEFIQLRVSKKRQGRKEFIEAIKRPQDMLGMMGGPGMGLWNNKRL